MTPSNLVKEALLTLIKSSKGQYVANVIEICKRDHSWTDEECELDIRNAVEEGVVVEKMHAGKDSLRIVEVEGCESVNVYISDNTEHTDSQTEAATARYLTYDDFIAFKKYISSITANTATSINNIGHDLNKQMSDQVAHLSGRIDNIISESQSLQHTAHSRSHEFPDSNEKY